MRSLFLILKNANLDLITESKICIKSCWKLLEKIRLTSQDPLIIIANTSFLKNIKIIKSKSVSVDSHILDNFDFWLFTFFNRKIFENVKF